MGQGRRMNKKQGAPEPLSDRKLQQLKRKAGLPVDPLPPTATSSSSRNHEPAKKRRRESTSNGGRNTKTEETVIVKRPKTNQASQIASGPKKAAKPTSAVKANSKVAGVAAKNKKTKMPLDDVLSSEDDEDSDGGALLDADVEGDDFLGDDGAASDEDMDGDENDSVFDSDEEAAQKGTRHVFSEDEDESDTEEKLTLANIQGLSRKLDEEMAREEEDAERELQEAALQTNIDGDKPSIFGNEGEGGEEGDEDEDEDDEDGAFASGKPKALLTPDLQVLRTRITENIRVLESFAELAEEGRSRSEYTSQLLRDMCLYYGYSPYLAEKLFSLFTPSEAFAFFEANESARPVVIRTNTLRTHRRDLAQALIQRGVTLEPVGKWSKVGLQIFESNVPLGATPEYLAGHYILQAASSFLPCMALDPRENERVLDMAAAPGGKTTYLSALMKNTGFILANDPSKARAKALIGNVHRLGCRNVVVCNHDARDFPRPMGGFDRVLLDAPCSGTGVIAKDPSVKTNKTERDFLALPHTQKQLLLAAIDSVNHASKTGGYVVYSTCSVTVEENEQVVQYALSRRPNVRLVETGLTFGREGFVRYMGKHFDASLKLTRRYYPHTYNVDGFYVAKFQKFAPTPESALKTRAELDAEITADRTPLPVDDILAATSADGKKKRRKATSATSSAHTVATTSQDTVEVGEGAVNAETDFAFDDEEDREYIAKAQRNAMRRRGLDPHALSRPKKANKTDAEKAAEVPKKEVVVAKEERKKKATLKNEAAQETKKPAAAKVGKADKMNQGGKKVKKPKA